MITASCEQVISQKEAALARTKAVEKQKMDMQLQHEELRCRKHTSAGHCMAGVT